MSGKLRSPSAQTPSNISDVSTDLVRSEVGTGSQLLGKAFAPHSSDLWGLLCTKGGRPPDVPLGGRCSGEPDLRGRYKATAKIGQGSTSVVYKGLRHADGQKVAIKILHGKTSEDTHLAEEEYKILRQLRHPCIVQVLDLQSAGGHPTLVLEHCEGADLLATVHCLHDRRLREAQACKLTASLVRAVQHLHKQGVVHCDVRPQNILVSHDIQALKLLDFGSAILLSDGDRSGFAAAATSGPQVACQAPEVILGEEPTPCADVWQVGLCTYFMLSGSLPQKRDTCKPIRDAIRSVATHRVSFTSPQWTDIPRGVKVLLRRCMTIDKLQRPTSHDLVRKSAWLRPTIERAAAADGDRLFCDPISSGLLPGSREHSIGDDIDRPESSSHGHSQETLSSLNAPGGCLSVASAPTTVGTDMTLGDEACSKAVLVGPGNEKAVILLINYGERTYKVRFPDGRIKTVPAEDIQRA